jgi:hypothetical protein
MKLRNEEFHGYICCDEPREDFENKQFNIICYKFFSTYYNKQTLFHNNIFLQVLQVMTLQKLYLLINSSLLEESMKDAKIEIYFIEN